MLLPGIALLFIKMVHSLPYEHVYLHECVVRKDGGMYATCHLPQETVIASFPKNETRSGMTVIEYSDHLSAVKRNASHPWHAFAMTLPTTCQSPFGNCGFPMRSETTIAGRTLIHAVVSENRPSVMDSVVKSRQWDHGMIPILEFFNHDSSLGKILQENTTHYFLETAYYQPKGSHIYISYGNSRTLVYYVVYGFIDYSTPFSCDDMRTLRIRDQNETRIQCIANSTSTKSQMEEEKKEALEVDDIAMVQGAALWLKRHLEHS